MQPILTNTLGRVLRFVPLFAVAFFFGCGDDDSPSGPTSSNPDTAAVVISPGSSVPGCEEDDNCYLPFEARIRPGGEVTWSNDDTSAHTITSGTAAGGPDEHFDSSLIMSGRTFTTKLEMPGTYDYFCMVHPWMTGVVVVE